MLQNPAFSIRTKADNSSTYTVSQKTSKIIFVITTPNFHQM